MQRGTYTCKILEVLIHKNGFVSIRNPKFYTHDIPFEKKENAFLKIN